MLRTILIKKALLTVIKACFYLIVFAPILITSAFFFPAIFTKVAYVRLLVEVALVCYVPLAIMAPEYRPRRNIVFLLVVIFAAIVFITSLTGANFSYSFWGNYERMDGIFSWIHYWFLFFLVASVLKTKKEWQKLFAASLAAALLVSIYGFLQRLGSNRVYETNITRITGTIGNPGFLAAYLLCNITFGLNIVIDAAVRWRWKILVILDLAALFVAYFLTGIRGAFVGLVAGLMLGVVGYVFWLGRGQVKRLGILAMVFFVISLSVLFAVRQSDFVTSHNALNRYLNISFNDSTVQTRLISWGGAIKGIKENFWLGVGPQKFDIIFNKYFDPQFYTLVGTETWWDRAHNMFLEVFSTMGIFGLLVYLSIGAGILYFLWRLGQKDARSRLEALLFMCFWVAFFIQNLFIFDNINTYIMTALIMGYVISRYYETTLSDVPKKFNPGSNWLIGLVLALLFMAPVAYAGNIKLVIHNRVFLSALSPREKPLPLRLALYRETIRQSDFDHREVAIRLGQFMGQYSFNHTLSPDDLKAGFNFALNEMEKAIAKNPQDVRLLLAYGNAANVYAELARKQDPALSDSVLVKSEKALLQAVQLGPARQQVWYSLANVYLIRGDNKRGIEMLEETVKLNPEMPSTYWLASIAYAQSGQIDKAIQRASDALVKGYAFTDENETASIARILLDRKEYAMLLKIYKKVDDDIWTPRTAARLAALYAQMGMKKEAIDLARDVFKRDASYKDEALEFIKIVESGKPYDFIEEIKQ